MSLSILMYLLHHYILFKYYLQYSYNAMIICRTSLTFVKHNVITLNITVFKYIVCNFKLGLLKCIFYNDNKYLILFNEAPI